MFVIEIQRKEFLKNKKGVLFGLGNIALLALYIEVPILAYFLSYGGLLLLAGGAAVKFGKGNIGFILTSF